jgi:monoamine oxidase
MVERLTPSSRAMLEILLPGRVSRSRAWRILLSGHRRGPSEALAAGAGGVQALAGAFHDELADELG